MKSKLILATFNSGSTYIQRSLTFWIHELIDDRIRNPHELLNGIVQHDGYLVKQWMDVNAQSVDELMDILSSNQHPIVLRLAYDHCLLRHDQQDLERLYQFLNDRFDTYYSRRDNLFDYGMCYSIRKQTNRAPDKQLNNVYSAEERNILYSDELTFTVVADDVVAQAKKYLDYIAWVDRHFKNAVAISYEETEQDIDSVLQRITGTSQSIKHKYGISISDYTLVQYQRSKKIIDAEHHLADRLQQRLSDLCDKMVMIDAIPIKSTTMIDKMHKVKNFDECVDTFNRWAKNHAVSEINQTWLENQTIRTNTLYQGR